ncbi:hypothetical protein, partial [Salipaludibacillus sp. CF4.18]
MNKYRKLTILFVCLGSVFIAGGFALNQYYFYSLAIGGLASFVTSLVGLWFAVKWVREENISKE